MGGIHECLCKQEVRFSRRTKPGLTCLTPYCNLTTRQSASHPRVRTTALGPISLLKELAANHEKEKNHEESCPICAYCKNSQQELCNLQCCEMYCFVFFYLFSFVLFSFLLCCFLLCFFVLFSFLLCCFLLFFCVCFVYIFTHFCTLMYSLLL